MWRSKACGSTKTTKDDLCNGYEPGLIVFIPLIIPFDPSACTEVVQLPLEPSPTQPIAGEMTIILAGVFEIRQMI